MDSNRILSEQNQNYGGMDETLNDNTKRLTNTVEDSVEKKKIHDQIPRVVVRDHLGRELNTQTAYQEAITRARWRRRYRLVPLESEEWRLPHGILPARPDYSRQAPPQAGRLPLLQRLQRSKEWLQNENNLQQMLVCKVKAFRYIFVC